MRIAVDAMGGDRAPSAIVEGVILALRSQPDISRLLLTGDEPTLKELLKEAGDVASRIEIVHTTEVVGMDEAPAVAVRRKKDSSIGRAVDLVKNGEAEAFFSAGNTGAVVAASTLKLRTLAGVDRPAIAVISPSPVKPFILIDAGANIDSTPTMLAQFAVMGSVYSREILGKADPLVGLMSIGEEAAKGSTMTKNAFKVLDASPLKFHGNVEGSDLFKGLVDVVVCDGFVGNIILKTTESVARAMGHWLKDEFMRNPLRLCGAFLLRGAIKDLRRKTSAETYGGAPLLGTRGVVVIGHGSSGPAAVANALRFAAESVRHDVNHIIEKEIAALNVMEPVAV